MACKDCFNNCFQIISDTCVQYTGPDIPLLGICQGDQLSAVEAVIFSSILSALDGTGIQPKDVTLENCAFLKAQTGVNNPGLNALLQLLIDNACTVNTLITNINNQLAAKTSTVFDIGCLTIDDPNPTSDEILQAVVFFTCNLNDQVAAIPANYVKLADLTNLVTPIIKTVVQESTGTSGVPQQYAKMVPYVAYEYYGPLSNFDGSGIGLEPLGFSKVYICNGGNGTPDRRGRTAVGAIQGVPGGALDAAVDPSNVLNTNWSLKQKAGENQHLNTINEIPSHTHTITDPGHAHNIIFANYRNVGGSSTPVPTLGNDPNTPITSATLVQKATTGITVAATGGSKPHNNIQPSIAAYFIMYLP